MSAKHEEGVGEALRGTRAAQHRGEREGVWRHRGRGTMGVRQGVRDDRRMAAYVAHAVTWRWKAEVLLLWGSDLARAGLFCVRKGVREVSARSVAAARMQECEVATQNLHAGGQGI